MLITHLLIAALHSDAAFAVSPTCLEERNEAVESCEKRLRIVKNSDPGQFSGGSDYANTDIYSAMNNAMANKAADAGANCEDSRTWFDKRCTEALKQPRPNVAAIESQRRNGISELNDLIARANALQAQYRGLASSATAQNDSRSDSTRVRAGIQPPHVFQKYSDGAQDE